MNRFQRILSLSAVALGIACGGDELLEPSSTMTPSGSVGNSIGVGSSGETIATDKNDYSPGDTVLITGSGWEPGETVRLLLVESPVVHGSRDWSVLVDSAGSLEDRSFVIEEHHFKVTFTLTASGLSSGRSAQTIFTDGTFFWRGCTSTDWHTGSNWATSSGTGCPISTGSVAGVPTINDDVVIQNVTNDPVIGSSAVAKTVLINTGGVLTIGANLSLSDNVNINGTWNHTGGTVSFTTGGKKITIGASGTGTYSQSGGTVGSLSSNPPDYLIESNGSAAQSGGALNVNILEIKANRTFSQSNGGSGSLVALVKDWKNEGTFSSTGGKVRFAPGAVWASPSSATNQFFDIELDAAVSPNAQIVRVAGEWINDASLGTSNAHTIEFNGGSNQNIGGTVNTTFRGLRVNKGGGDLNLALSQTVQNVLTLTQGNIVTAGQTLTIAAGGSVTRTSGHVVGNLRKAINATGTVSRTYEVGTGSNYTPINVTMASVGSTTAGTTTNFLTGSSISGDHPSLGASDINPAKSVNRHWKLTKAGGWTFTNYDAQFHFVATDIDAGANTADFVVRKFDASWSSPPAGSVAAATSTTGNDFTTFSDYAVGSTAPSDGTAPDVTIDQAAGQADPTNGSTINFTVVFTEAVSGFTNTDVDLTTSSVGGTLVANVTETGPTTYNVAVTGMSGTGNVVATIPAGAATDGATNPSTASTSTDNSVAFDGVGPTVTINEASGQADPTSSSPINFTVVFNETVTDFTDSDVDLTQSTAGGTLVPDVTGGPATYNVAVTGMTSDGNVIARVLAGVASDALGNANTASTSTDNTVAFAGGPTKLAYTTAARTGAVAQCLDVITVQTQNAAGAARNVPGNLTVNLATDGGGSGAGAFYSDSDCGSAITSALIASGDNSASFYYKASSRGSGQHELTASATGLSSATQTQTINKADQTITFTSTAPSNAEFGGTYTVSATATSGLTVAFSSLTASVCTVTGSTVDFVGVGTCQVAANQAGNTNYNAAPQVTQSFGVAKADQTITFTSTPPASPVFGGTYTVSATATSGLTVAFSSLTASVCSVTGSTVDFVGVGTCQVAANQAGNANYNPAPQVTQSMTVEYIFDGFFAPVDKPNTMNVSKAGQAIPLKWRLLDDDGNPVTNLATVTVQAVNVGCSAGESNDVLEEYASGASGLQNLGDGYYQFNWKTPTSYAGTCKSIKLVFGSGALSYTVGPLAYFTFKR